MQLPKEPPFVRSIRWPAFLAGSLVFAFGCSSSSSGNEKTGVTKPPPGEAGAPTSADWTMLAHDVNSTYWNQAETKISTTSVKQMTKAWDYDTQQGVSATPVISGGRVYIQSATTFALDLATGKLIWHNDNVGGASSLTLVDGVLYAHDAHGVMHALHVEDGTEIWQHLADDDPALGGFSSPVVTGNYVLVGGSSAGQELSVPAGGPTFRGFVLALNKADGSVAWKKYTVDPPAHGATLWSTVSVDEAAGMVIAGTGNNYRDPATDTSDAFLALSLTAGDGPFLWKDQILANDRWMVGSSDPDADFGANPILVDVNGRKLAAGGNKGGNFWVIDRTNGTIIKQLTLGPGSAFKGGVFNGGAWDGHHFLVVCNGATSTGPGSVDSSNPSTLFALDPLTLDIAWERQVNGPVFSPITVANGVGFFASDNVLQAFDTSTGEKLFEFTTEGTVGTAPAVSNGYVIFGSGMNWIQTKAGTKYYALKVP
jgi:polyvinyl alcohol dehydrogenase (cytochrome)